MDTALDGYKEGNKLMIRYSVSRMLEYIDSRDVDNIPYLNVYNYSGGDIIAGSRDVGLSSLDERVPYTVVHEFGHRFTLLAGKYKAGASWERAMEYLEERGRKRLNLFVKVHYMLLVTCVNWMSSFER